MLIRGVIVLVVLGCAFVFVLPILKQRLDQGGSWPDEKHRNDAEADSGVGFLADVEQALEEESTVADQVVSDNDYSKQNTEVDSRLPQEVFDESGFEFGQHTRVQEFKEDFLDKFL